MENIYTQIAKPHDHYFRELMSRPPYAKAFLKEHLPSGLKKRIDWKSLRLENESHINEILEEQITDVVLSVNAKGRKVYFYALIEAQSTVDSLMAHRIQKYIHAIIDDHLKKHKTRKPPLVCPLLIYNGKKPWPQPITMASLYDDEEKAIVTDVFLSGPIFIDLHRISDEEIKKKNKYIHLMQGALKWSAERDKIKALENLGQKIFEQIDMAIFNSTAMYISCTSSEQSSVEKSSSGYIITSNQSIKGEDS